MSGVPVVAIILSSMTACGVLTGSSAGVLMTSRLGNADPTIGPGYMLPAFTAAFLGSAQFHHGRFNVAGTILSVYVLAAGIKGLQLSGVPTWVADGFNGAALRPPSGLHWRAQLGNHVIMAANLRPRRAAAQIDAKSSRPART